MQTVELIRGHKHRGIYRKAGEQLTVTETVARRLVMRRKAKPADGAAKGAASAPAAAKKAPKKSAAKKSAAKKGAPAQSNTES